MPTRTAKLKFKTYLVIYAFDRFEKKMKATSSLGEKRFKTNITLYMQQGAGQWVKVGDVNL